VKGVSLLIGVVAALAIGLGVAWLGLPTLIALPLGGAVGALLGHREDTEAAALGFIIAAAIALIPSFDAAEAVALAMTGYTVGRHT